MVALPETRARHHVASGGGGLAVGMFAVLLGSYAVNAMDRQIFPLLLRDVQADYHFSLAGAGLLSTVFTLGMAVAGLPASILLTRLSRRAVVQVGLIVFSLATALTATAAGFWSMLVFRALTGVGEAVQLTALLAIAGSYFASHRAAAIGSINSAFGVGAIVAPVLGGTLLETYGTWHAPMVAFGLIGLVFVGLIACTVRPRLTEVVFVPVAETGIGGAASLRNRETLLLAIMSVLGGQVIYGYLGMYPTFLRSHLGFTPAQTAHVMSFYGFGVLASVGGGAIGDRFSARVLLATSFAASAVLGLLLYTGPAEFGFQAAVSFAWGLVVSGTIYVNLASCHVKAVSRALTARASGLFVTTLYASASVAGLIVGWVATQVGWTGAGLLESTAVSILAAGVALRLRLGRLRAG